MEARETVVTIRANDIIVSGDGFESGAYPTADEWRTKIKWAQQRLQDALAEIPVRAAAEQVLN
jgi:protein involved in polysaccharide export with SLBB domain